MKDRMKILTVEPEAGHVTPFVVIITVALLAVAGLVLDAGLALSTKTRAMDAAQSAARAGAQQLDLDLYRTTGTAELNPDSATRAAQDWLATVGLSGDASATDETVTVTVYAVHDTKLLNLIGIGEINVSATATATPLHGVSEPES